jgi:hypothetical protein
VTFRGRPRVSMLKATGRRSDDHQEPCNPGGDRRVRQDQGDADQDGTKKGADEKNSPPMLTEESLPSLLDPTLRELSSQECYAFLIGNI